MADEATFLDTELTLQGFIRDLSAFLNLSESQLRTISEIGDQTEGFTGTQQTLTLQRRLDIPAEEATAHLSLAQHLYRRVDTLGLDVVEATNQVVSIGSTMEEPITIDVPKRDAIAAVLSVKREYEVGRANRGAVGNVPHFVDLNGSWNVKAVRIRGGEVLGVPVIDLSIVWHDGTGATHETYLQMDDGDWEDFTEKINMLNSRRSDIETFLQEEETIG